MKTVVFAGTKVGWAGLSALIEAGAEVACVFVDDEHAHETEKFAGHITELCTQHGIVYKRNASISDITTFVETHSMDYLFCFGFRRMLPDSIINKAKGAACSTHFSLLPKYRGFAPVNWAIINGEERCGVSLFHMASDMDAGDLVDQRGVAIESTAYVGEVMEDCLVALRDLLLTNWKDFARGSVKRIAQKHEHATYTCARNPEDGEINWSDSTETIYNLIRGCSTPFPGAYTTMGREKLIVWSAEPYELPEYVGRIPGKVVKIVRGEGVVVLTGDGGLLVREVSQCKEGHAQVACNLMTADQVITSVRLTLGR